MLAVSLQAFFHVDDAPAYGLCMACHGQDLVQTIIADVGVGPDRRALPLLTTVGVVLGAVWAARRNHETARWSGGVHWRRVVFGMLAGFCSLVAMGCPTRLWLRIGYGDVTAIAPVVSMVGAVVITTMILRRWARRA